MNHPLISICIPVYNGQKYLRECLESVCCQSYSNIEIIIVDDKSSDGSCEIISEYVNRDKRILFHKNETNSGLVANWNSCLKLAKGEWIKFVFQDDLIEENCLERMFEAAANHSFVACSRKFIFDDTVSEDLKFYFENKLLTIDKIIETNQNEYLNNKKVSKVIASNCSLNFIGEPTAVLFKRNLIEQVGMFNPDLAQLCDLEYWQRIISREGIIYVPLKLISFRVHQHSASTINKLEKNKFKSAYLDVVIIAHELLFADLFNAFRKSLNYFEKFKLKFFLKAKLYEARLSFMKDESVNRNYFDLLFKKYPRLEIYYQPSIFTKIIYQIILLKRKISGIA